MLIIEIDGGTHGTAQEIAADEVRARALQALGYRIHRAWNADIMGNIDGVLDAIIRLLETS